MSNKFFIQSQLGDYVIDIEGGSTTPKVGTNLDAFTKKSSNNTNQQWEFTPASGNPGYFFIKSVLGNYVIDIEGGGTAPKAGTLLDVFTQKSSNNGNQLWTSVAGPAAHPGFFFIKSALGNYVIDIAGGGTAPKAGTALDAFTQKSSNNGNQLWQLVSVPGNSFSPKIANISNNPINPPFVSISGSGFFPGSQASILFSYTDVNGVTTQNSGSPAIANIDFGGGLTGAFDIDTLKPEVAGNLTIQVTDPNVATTKVNLHWDGSEFHFT